MRRTLTGLVVAVALLAAAGPAFAYDDGDGGDGSGNDCQSGGCGTEHHHNGDNIHFERIGPVYICTVPGSCAPPDDKKGHNS